MKSVDFCGSTAMFHNLSVP